MRRLKDGIYNMTGIDFLMTDYKDWEYKREDINQWVLKRPIPKHIEDFLIKHPNHVLASAYDTDTFIILANEPKLLFNNKSPEWIGNGFNYGSTNILTNLPNAILILAEND
jgi:hypothetical protein